MNTTKCSVCNYVFDPRGLREPCPECGSPCRAICAVITETSRLYDGLGYKVRNLGFAGRRKVRSEGFRRYERSEDDGVLVIHQRNIDRSRDRYYELVEDADTGAIRHGKEEPLSEHRGHGSAKYKRDVSA